MPPRQENDLDNLPNDGGAVEGSDNNKNNDKKVAATAKFGRSPVLIKAVPSICPSPLPLHYWLLAHLSALMVPASFVLGPLLLTATLPAFLFSVRAGLGLLVTSLILAYFPVKQWPAFRKFFQLWYQLYDCHHNIALEEEQQEQQKAKKSVEDTALVIYSNHPHGIVPIHGYLWCALCDQLFTHRYGFGALTDIALRLPFLRQIMLWLSSAPATKSVLVKRLNAGENLYILPGGVAEIFLACPGKNVIKTPRRGVIKLALETGALLVPSYAFGANDFYHQLATYGQGSSSSSSTKVSRKSDPTNVIGKFQRKISRSFKGGFTLFWGQFGLPKPFQPKCSIVLGDPIEPVPGTLGAERTGNGKMTCRRVAKPTESQIDELLCRYTDALICLFEQYKEQAGYPDATLELE